TRPLLSTKGGELEGCPLERVEGRQPFSRSDSTYGRMEKVRGPGVRRGSARLANSQRSLRVSRGSTISSTQKVSAVRKGERRRLRRASISASLALGADAPSTSAR